MRYLSFNGFTNDIISIIQYTDTQKLIALCIPSRKLNAYLANSSSSSGDLNLRVYLFISFLKFSTNNYIILQIYFGFFKKLKVMLPQDIILSKNSYQMNNQQIDQSRPFCIVGGGLAGPMLAIILARKGFQVKLLERRPDIRVVKQSAGRSINLALSARGFKALNEIGLKVKFEQISIPMLGRMIHSLDGSTKLLPYGKNENEAIYSVSRELLNIELLNVASSFSNIEIIFEANCVSYDLKDNTLSLVIKNEQELTVKNHLVIGADGYRSVIRDAMFQKTRMNFSQHFESHGYKELTIPAAKDGGFQIEKNALHIWPRGGYMLIALPNIDGNFTSTLFLSQEGNNESFEQLKSEEDINNFFKQQFPDVLNLIPDLTKQFLANPIGSLCTIKCEPWNYGDQCLILGDAAHALVPFYGQGMNCAFEDCSIFSEMLDQRGKEVDWRLFLKDFTSSRKANCDAIADMAVENFIEMRDLVNDKFFQFKKQCELKIAKDYPEFITKYSLVSFSTTPYLIAQKRGRIHDMILSEMCKTLESADDFNTKDAFERIIAKYQEEGV